MFQLLDILQLRLLQEISGAGHRRDVIPALGCLVPIQHGERQVFYIQGNAVTQDQHQQRGTDKGEGHSNGIPQQFPRFPGGVSQQAPGTEHGRPVTMTGGLQSQLVGAGLRLFIHRFQGFHERAFQAVGARGFNQSIGRIASQYFARVHERNPVAALTLVHEMSGDKNGHAIFPRQAHQQLPEPVAGPRVDA